MNGVSYNMLKYLPEELIANLHYCLTRIWRKRRTPDWLSDRWLVTISKKEHDIVKVCDLGPLSLVDTVRKVWCKVSLLLMLAVWKKHDVLRNAQHGFCAGRSTITATLLLIYQLEKEFKKAKVLHTSS